MSTESIGMVVIRQSTVDALNDRYPKTDQKSRYSPLVWDVVRLYRSFVAQKYFERCPDVRQVFDEWAIVMDEDTLVASKYHSLDGHISEMNLINDWEITPDNFELVRSVMDFMRDIYRQKERDAVQAFLMAMEIKTDEVLSGVEEP